MGKTFNRSVQAHMLVRELACDVLGARNSVKAMTWTWFSPPAPSASDRTPSKPAGNNEPSRSHQDFAKSTGEGSHSPQANERKNRITLMSKHDDNFSFGNRQQQLRYPPRDKRSAPSGQLKVDPSVQAIKEMLIAQERREKEKAIIKERELAEAIQKGEEDKLDALQKMITEHYKQQLEWRQKQLIKSKDDEVAKV